MYDRVMFIHTMAFGHLILTCTTAVSVEVSGLCMPLQLLAVRGARFLRSPPQQHGGRQEDRKTCVSRGPIATKINACVQKKINRYIEYDLSRLNCR